MAPGAGHRDILGRYNDVDRTWLSRGPAGRQADGGEDDGLLGRQTEELDAEKPGRRALPHTTPGRKAAGPPPAEQSPQA